VKTKKKVLIFSVLLEKAIFLTTGNYMYERLNDESYILCLFSEINLQYV